MQQRRNVVIIAAGEISKIEYERTDKDVVIAADKGYLWAQDNKIECDHVLGDFDSLGSIPEHKMLTVLPVEKDDTDTAYAVKCALSAGAERIFMLGGLGGRLDHTLANIQLLSYIANRNAVGFLVSDREMLCVARSCEVQLFGKSGQAVSVFSLSNVSSGVSEQGLKYRLENADIKSEFPIGISNEMVSDVARISVTDGELLIYARGDMSSFIRKNRDVNTGVNRKLNIYI